MITVTRKELQSLLRICIEHKAEHLLFIEAGKTKGLIPRNSLISSLSNVHEDSKDLPAKQIKNISEALAVLEMDNAGTSENPLLPVINSKLEFIGLWGRTEILQSWENVPRVSVWAPPQIETILQNSPTPRENIPSPNITSESIPLSTQKPRIAVYTIQKTIDEKNIHDAPAEHIEPEDKEERNRANAATELIESVPGKRNPIFQKIQPVIPGKENSLSISEEPKAQVPSPDSLAIATIEALSLPLLACDLEGKELFHNEDWVRAMRFSGLTLGSEKLFKIAKQKTAQALMHPAHIPGDPIVLEDLVPGRLLKMRPLKIKEEREENTKGFLFWIEDKKSGDMTVPPQAGVSYKGRTLTEIVESEEKKALLWAMDQTDNNQSDAAMLLGIPRQTFSYKYRKYFKGRK